MSIFLERFLIPILAVILGNGLLLANPMEISWHGRIIGIVSIFVLAGLVALFSGKYDELRQRQYPRLSKFILIWRRRFMSLFQMWPTIGIVIGGLIFIACVLWQLAENRRANVEIQETLSRYVLPRHLLEQQITTIGEYLSKYDPQQFKMVVIKNNEEASSYRADIQRALTLGGWEVSTIDYLDDVREGISLQFTETQESSQRRPDPKHPKPLELLQRAFQQARVQVAGGGSGSGVSITANSMTISIGRRRMDDGDLIGKKQMQERARRILEGEDQWRPF